MAARTPIPSPSLSLLPGRGGTTTRITAATTVSWYKPVTRVGGRSVARVYAAGGGKQRASSDVDTRIHWENEDDGWVGGSTTRAAEEEEQKNNLLGEKFSELLNNSTDSHYQLVFLISLSKTTKIKIEHEF